MTTSPVSKRVAAEAVYSALAAGGSSGGGPDGGAPWAAHSDSVTMASDGCASPPSGRCGGGAEVDEKHQGVKEAASTGTGLTSSGGDGAQGQRPDLEEVGGEEAVRRLRLESKRSCDDRE